MRQSFLCTLACASLFTAAPAAARTVEDEQVWLNATLMGTLPGGKLAYFLEAQPRIVDGADRLGQLILRPAIGWKFSSRVTAYAGYAHILLPIENGPDNNEDRLFAQLSWTLKPVQPGGRGGSLSSRTRIEHRRLSNGNDTGWRLREMLRYVDPLGSAGKTRALVSLEGFAAFNDTDWGARSGFDQLRSFVGAEIPIGGKSTIEAGYLNQLVNARGGVTRMNHVLSLSLFVRP